MIAVLPSANEIPAHVPLAVATRGDLIESIHYGSIAVVDHTSRLVHQAGDPGTVMFTRSACKPLQAIPLVAHEGIAQFGFTPQEIAIICASHSGEPRHLEAVLSILAKISCRKSDLQCGAHSPFYYEAVGRQPKAEEIFTFLHHNCSGNHAGMLALCKLMKAPIENYPNLDHPVQQAILQAVSHFSEVPFPNIGVGIDGCSVPNFALPLASLALGYAKLASSELDPHYGQAPRVVFAAMTKHPEMVSGIKRLDLALMHTGGGNWIAKSGAEGVQGLGIRGRGWGIAIKIADGASRALPVVAVEVLRQLGLLKGPENTALESFARPKLVNCRAIETGEVRPIFRLR